MTALNNATLLQDLVGNRKEGIVRTGCVYGRLEQLLSGTIKHATMLKCKVVVSSPIQTSIMFSQFGINTMHVTDK